MHGPFSTWFSQRSWLSGALVCLASLSLSACGGAASDAGEPSAASNPGPVAHPPSGATNAVPSPSDPQPSATPSSAGPTLDGTEACTALAGWFTRIDGATEARSTEQLQAARTDGAAMTFGKSRFTYARDDELKALDAMLLGLAQTPPDDDAFFVATRWREHHRADLAKYCGEHQHESPQTETWMAQADLLAARMQAGVTACAQASKADGALSVKARIAEDGSVLRAMPSEHERLPVAFVACVLRRIEAERFPAPKGQTYLVMPFAVGTTP